MHWPPNIPKAMRKAAFRPPRTSEYNAYVIGCRNRIWRAQDGRCAFCGQRVRADKANNDDDPSIDHVVPWALGGKDDMGNFVVMHQVCNTIKGRAMPNGCVLIWLLAVNARLGVGPVRW